MTGKMVAVSSELWELKLVKSEMFGLNVLVTCVF